MNTTMPNNATLLKQEVEDAEIALAEAKESGDENSITLAEDRVKAAKAKLSDTSTAGGRRRRMTMKKMKKMSKRKMAKWCKSKKNRRTKAGRKMCKK